MSCVCKSCLLGLLCCRFAEPNARSEVLGVSDIVGEESVRTKAISNGKYFKGSSSFDDGRIAKRQRFY